MPVSRRSFLTRSALAGSSLILSSLENFAAPLPQMPASPGFSLKIMATNWGYPGSITEFCAAAKKEGYDGIEMWLPGNENSKNELRNATTQQGLATGLLCAGSDRDFTTHFRQFRENLSAAAAFKPLYINCHSGKDFFSFEQNKQIIDFSNEIAARSGIPVYHETHRGRMLFAAHITKNFIEQTPQLRLTFDVSHWCNVHESLLADQQDTVDLALNRVDHIHARIGHPEGPQVNDPRAPEWEQAVKAHFNWWDTVVAKKKKEGLPMTFLTEFGPPDYMPTLPYTRQPLAGQWQINAYMMQLLRKRYLP